LLVVASRPVGATTHANSALPPFSSNPTSDMAARLSATLIEAAAAGRMDEVLRLVAAGADLNASDGTVHSSPLHWAASRGHAGFAEKLLASGAQPNIRNSMGWVPLMSAAVSGWTDVMAVLLAAGADVDVSDRKGDTALHWTVVNGQLPAIKLLLDAGARVDARNVHGLTPADKVRVHAAPAHHHSAIRVCMGGHCATRPIRSAGVGQSAL